MQGTKITRLIRAAWPVIVGIGLVWALLWVWMPLLGVSAQAVGPFSTPAPPQFDPPLTAWDELR